MHKEIFRKLVACAKAGDILSYSEIAPLAGLNMENPADRLELGAILGEISESEHAKGHPLLSAIVLHKNDSVAGDGFFKLASSLGLFLGGDKVSFLINEIKRVHAHWQTK